MAHQGRRGDPDFIPIEQHAEILCEVLDKPVKYVDDLFGEKVKRVNQLKSEEILVLENVRVYPEEQARSERTCNYNQLLRIEEELGRKAKYSGGFLVKQSLAMILK